MVFVVLVIVVVLVLTLVSVTRARKNKPATRNVGAETELESQPEPRPPTFKVVALGLSGSGKTVLLASMFHHLNYVTSLRNYFLDATPEQRVKLNTIYRTISDTDQGWPRGTRV